MDMAGGILGSDGLLGVLELASVPSLTGGPFYICHDDESDDVIWDNDAISFRFARLDLELLDGVDDLATEIESGGAERHIFRAGVRGGGALRGIDDRLEEQVDLHIIN